MVYAIGCDMHKRYSLSAIVVSMLTPLARRVISRIRCLNRSGASGAIVLWTAGPILKLNPFS